MENASKALIIAGAILISILLISVAILVINSTSGVTDQVQGNMDAIAVQQYNAKFDPYIGPNKTALDVKNLISVITANNGLVESGDRVFIFTDNFSHPDGNVGSVNDAKAGTKSLQSVISRLNTTKKYTITAVGVRNGGYYSTIKITEN